MQGGDAAAGEYISRRSKYPSSYGSAGGSADMADAARDDAAEQARIKQEEEVTLTHKLEEEEVSLDNILETS